MGTDYYLVDPVSKVVRYIDRAGSDFACCYPGPARVEVPDWPHGPVRVVNRVLLAELAKQLDEDPEAFLSGTRAALEWCKYRLTVLLVDDTTQADEEANDFCFKVVFVGVEGWTGEQV